MLSSSLYEQDYYFWANDQAEELIKRQIERLDWEHSELQGSSCKATIREQRRKIDRLLQRNPGLKQRWNEAFDEAWSDGRDLPIRETGLGENIFPEVPCFDSQEVQDENYWTQA